MQPLSKSQCHVLQNLKKKSLNLYGIQKTLNSQNDSLRTKLAASHFLISKYLTKLPSSKQCRTSIKTCGPRKAKKEPENKPSHIWSNSLWWGCQDYTMGKDNLLNRWCWENWKCTSKRKELDPYLARIMQDGGVLDICCTMCMWSTVLYCILGCCFESEFNALWFFATKKEKKIGTFSCSCIYPPYGPSNVLLGIYSREMKMYALKKTCT